MARPGRAPRVLEVIFSLDKLLSIIQEIHAPLLDFTQHLTIPETLDKVYHYIWAPGIECQVVNTVMACACQNRQDPALSRAHCMTCSCSQKTRLHNAYIPYIPAPRNNNRRSCLWLAGSPGAADGNCPAHPAVPEQ